LSQQGNQPGGTQPSGKSGGKKALWVGAIAIIVIALGAGFYNYVGVTPHTVTLTSTNYATSTSTVTSTQSVTSFATNTYTNFVTTSAAAPVGNPYVPPYYAANSQQPCYYYYNRCYYYSSDCYYWGQCDFFNVCQNQGNNTVQCSGYLYQDPSGCTELVIGIWTPYAQPSYQYFTLQNLPASHPSFGSWVTVTGQSYRGSNTAPNGAACPGNYIVVSSIS
jgi:hypothetical protein